MFNFSENPHESKSDRRKAQNKSSISECFSCMHGGVHLCIQNPFGHEISFKVCQTITLTVSEGENLDFHRISPDRVQKKLAEVLASWNDNF